MLVRILIPLLALSGCIVAVDDSFCVDEEVDAILLDMENGDISIEPGDRLCVEVDLGGVGSNGIGSGVDDRLLFLDYPCGGACGGDVRITAPSKIHVDVQLGAGDISIDSRKGDVVAHLGAGSIQATDLQSEWAELLTGAGDIQAELLERPVFLDVNVAAGSIEIEVPAGGYALDLDADGGSIQTDGVFDEVDSDAKIRAHVSTGSIQIDGS